MSVVAVWLFNLLHIEGFFFLLLKQSRKICAPNSLELLLLSLLLMIDNVKIDFELET